MSYAYEGLATVTVLALYLGQPPKDLTTLELNVRVHNAGSGRFRIEFDRYLHGPKEANALRVILPGGCCCKARSPTGAMSGPVAGC